MYENLFKNFGLFIYFKQDNDNDEPSRQEGGTTAAFNNFLQKRASAIPTDSTSDRQLRLN